VSRLGFVLAWFVIVGAMLSPSKTEANAGAYLAAPSWSCSPGSASVAFTWTPSSGVVQWLDITLFSNGFVPGTFLAAGPMGLAQNSLRWDGIKPGLVHYWRVNTLTSAGWIPSATGQFVPCSSSSAPAPPAAPLSLTGLAGQLLSEHNAVRAAAGIAPLTVDRTLTQVAQERANDMASRSYFSHTSPTGETAFTIMGRYGMGYGLAAENIARNNYPDSQSASTAMSGFLNSPGHRYNIMDPALTRVGIAVAFAGGMKYYAVLFSGP
jgi:uncharacterized protein YkwD